ncbi:MAG: LAGLIDADG family homing endonuclease [bacterium]|nr:LAGLIDADG family homing endonuclease [bacterium]
MEREIISDEYLRGLVEGEGCFTFCNIPVIGKTGKKFALPAFTIQMHERDKSLIELLKLRLGLKNKIYVYKVRALSEKNKIYRRGPMAKLIVRDVASLKNKVVPFFYKKLHGNKGKQMIEWLEEIGNRDDIPENYKIIHRLYSYGYFD